MFRPWSCSTNLALLKASLAKVHRHRERVESGDTHDTHTGGQEHPGELATKVGYFGVKSAKVLLAADGT